MEPKDIISAVNAAYNVASGFYQNAYNRREVERAYQRQRQLIREANAYNSPANQKRLFMEAGFNPALSVTGGNFVQQQVGQSPNPIASADVGNGDALLQLKQGRLLDAQISSIEADVREKNIRIETQIFDLNYKKKVESYNLQKEQISVGIQSETLKKVIQDIKVGAATEEQLKQLGEQARINNETLSERNLQEINNMKAEEALKKRQEANIAFQENCKLRELNQKDLELKIMQQNANANTMNAQTNRMNAETNREVSKAEIRLKNAQAFNEETKGDLLVFQKELEEKAHAVKMANIEEKTKQQLLLEIQESKTALKQAEIAEDTAWLDKGLQLAGNVMDLATDAVGIATGTSGLIKGAKEMKGMVMPSKTEKKPLKIKEVRTGQIKGKDGKWYDNKTTTDYFYE